MKVCPSILLVGHGYLGKAVAREFRDHGWLVIPASLHGENGALSCDLGDPTSVAALPDADVILHCAASGRGGPDAYQRVYADGCRHLAHRFPDKFLIFTSSTSVYSQTDGSIVTETSVTQPDRETGKILLQAESEVLAHHGCVARLAGIYGPDRSVILQKFLAGTAIIEDDGRRLLNQIHRDDAARALFHLATLRPQGEIFNVSDSRPLSQLDCYSALARYFSKPLPPTGPRDLTRKRGWTHKHVSNAKLLASGWHPQFPSFPEALDSLISKNNFPAPRR